MILYTSLLWADGFTVAPWLILIRSKFRDDAPLLVHEQTHAEQMRRFGWLAFWRAYLTDAEARLGLEQEAYMAQLDATPKPALEARREQFACILARDYRLGITLEQARRILA